MWWVFPFLPTSPFFEDHYRAAYWEYVVRAETFAVLVEALYLRFTTRLSLRRALVLSFVANACSAGLGYVSRVLFHFP